MTRLLLFAQLMILAAVAPPGLRTEDPLCANAICECHSDQGAVSCLNFTEFAELNGSTISFSVNKLILAPLAPVKLGRDFELDQWTFGQRLDIVVRNVDGLDLLASPFRLATTRPYSLTFESSHLTWPECEAGLVDASFTSLFNPSFQVDLLGANTYSDHVCPLIFQNARLFRLEIDALSPSNRFEFDQRPLGDLNASVEYLYLKNSRLNLTNRLLDPRVFGRLEIMFLANATVDVVVDERVFEPFTVLRKLGFELNNFAQFFDNHRYNHNRWLSHLNAGVPELDLTNASQVAAHHDDRFLLELTDLTYSYKFPDADFCLFRHFPHRRLVFPVLSAGSHVTCTCTLLWLVQHHEIYANMGGDASITDDACLEEAGDLATLIANCKFEERLSECEDDWSTPESSSSTSSTSTTTTTESTTTTTTSTTTTTTESTSTKTESSSTTTTSTTTTTGEQTSTADESSSAATTTTTTEPATTGESAETSTALETASSDFSSPANATETEETTGTTQSLPAATEDRLKRRQSTITALTAAVSVCGVLAAFAAGFFVLQIYRYRHPKSPLLERIHLNLFRKN